MPVIHNKGNPTSDVYVLAEKPLTGDIVKGYLYSSPMGYVFDKMMVDAGFKDYFVTCIRPDTDDHNCSGGWESLLQQYKPPIIIPLGNAGKWLCTELKKKHQKIYNADESEIEKYAGSILTSDKLNWPHYIIPTLDPLDIVRQWKLRDVVVSCDLSKAASELDYFKTHNRTLLELPKIQAHIDFKDLDVLLWHLDQMRQAEYISNDIETIYPKAPTKTQPSQFYKILPGYPITVGLATNTTSGISFNLFRETPQETRELWKKLYKLLSEIPSVGQNFFNFDANYYQCLGFKLPLEKCRDTMILHHILWPELKHKLQFLARQYTRHPYWKDEGAGWSIKNMNAMKIYNVKDVCVTLEIFHKEMEEAIARGLV